MSLASEVGPTRVHHIIVSILETCCGFERCNCCPLHAVFSAGYPEHEDIPVLDISNHR
jgi:hypothetical protein